MSWDFWVRHPGVLVLYLFLAALLLAGLAMSLQHWLERAGRCQRCFRKIGQYQYDHSTNQVICPSCRFVLARYQKLPLMEGHLPQPREYRYSWVMRFGFLALTTFFAIGIFWIGAHPQDFADGRGLPLGLIATLGVGITWSLVLYSQVYLVSEDGMTARNLLWQKYVRWTEIQRVVRIPAGEGIDFLAIYTTRKRRWVLPRLQIPQFIQHLDELKGIIIAKAELTNASKRRMFFSAESYEKLSSTEQIQALTRS